MREAKPVSKINGSWLKPTPAQLEADHAAREASLRGLSADLFSILGKLDAGLGRVDFDAAYRTLADEAKADEPGGAEHARVYREWISAGRPAPVAAFILERANAAPSFGPRS